MKKLLLSILTITVFCFGVNAQWTQTGADIDGDEANNNTGLAVSISGDATTLVIGAPLQEVFNSGTYDGQVRTFDWNGTDWIQKGNDINAYAIGDKWGVSVDMSFDGNTFAAGGSTGGTSNAGYVIVYTWNGTFWNQKGMPIFGLVFPDLFGSSLSLSPDGNTLVVGARQAAVNGFNSGQVSVFTWDGSAWQQKGVTIDGDIGDISGDDVNLNSDGNTVAISSYGFGTNTGRAKVYEWNGTAWIQKGIDIVGENSGDKLGTVSLSSDGNTLATGEFGANGNTGRVKIYYWDGSAWIQKGVNIDGESTGDYWGLPICLSSDGNTFASGGQLNDGNGNNSGHVRVYTWSGSAWIQSGVDIDGESADDNSGAAISLSSDGTTVLIGAQKNDGGGNLSGHARVYSIGTIGISEQVNNINLSIYPNPVNNQITINTTAQISSISIIDITGKRVKTIVPNGNTLNVSELANGMYFLQVQTDKGLASKKFIKE